MAEVYVSPSGEVEIQTPSRPWPERWKIAVRGETVARGWARGGNLDPLVEGLEAVAVTCDQTPGLGEIGGQIRSLVAGVDRVAEEKG
jgi:hypothetical protein